MPTHIVVQEPVMRKVSYLKHGRLTALVGGISLAVLFVRIYIFGS